MLYQTFLAYTVKLHLVWRQLVFPQTLIQSTAFDCIFLFAYRIIGVLNSKNASEYPIH